MVVSEQRNDPGSSRDKSEQARTSHSNPERPTDKFKQTEQSKASSFVCDQ